MTTTKTTKTTPTKIRPRGRRTAAMVAVLASLSTVAPATAQTCPAGVSPRPWLGIGTYHCQGGNCVLPGIFSIMIPEARRQLRPDQVDAEGRPTVYSFTVEPRLWDVDPDGPAAGVVRDGDVLVAVNGAPITTSAATRELAAMSAGEPLRLTIRREQRGDEVVVTAPVTPVASCEGLHASAGPGERPYNYRRRPRRPTAPVIEEGAPLVRIESLGLTLMGNQEMRIDAAGNVRWWFAQVPVVAEVTAGGLAEAAGIRAGHELVTAGGERVTSPAGAERLMALAAERTGSVIVRVGTDARQLSIGR